MHLRTSDTLAIFFSVLWFFVTVWLAGTKIDGYETITVAPIAIFSAMLSIGLSFGVLMKYGNKWPLLISLIPLALFLYLIILPMQWVGTYEAPSAEIINFDGSPYINTESLR